MIAGIERDWAELIGEPRFDALADSMQALLDELDPRVRAGYTTPPSVEKRPS